MTNTTQNVPLKGGDEVDAFGPGKNVLIWKAGERKAIKRKYNRRNRRTAKQELRELRS